MVIGPMIILGASGFYTGGNQPLKVALTAVPLTLLSVWICSRYLDRRSWSDLGFNLKERIWWADYGVGVLAGMIAGTACVLLLVLLDWGELSVSYQWRYSFWRFVGIFLLSLVSYIGVGVFEELMRAYQIKNSLEGFLGRVPRWLNPGMLAVAVGAVWSLIAHLNRGGGPEYWLYMLITTFLYGCFYLWTGRAALGMAFHFAWDFTLSAIFELGTLSQGSLFVLRLIDFPGSSMDSLSLGAIPAKLVGFLLVCIWIWRKEGKIRMKPALADIQLLA